MNLDKDYWIKYWDEVKKETSIFKDKANRISVTIDIDKMEWDDLRVVCTLEGLDVNEVLNMLVFKWLHYPDRELADRIKS